MAKDMGEVERSLENLEKEIMCAVCQEHYTEPKVLPCLHYYCKQCILKLALKTGIDKPFPCPECCKEVTLPDGNEDKLSAVFFVNRLKALYAKQKKALSKEVHCEICTNSEAIAESFCKQCDKFVCENCVKMHTIMKAVFDNHTILSLDEFKKVQADEIVSKNSPAKKCQVHEELLKIFCFDCNQLICRDCTVKDHKDHSIEFNNIAAANKKKKLMNDLKTLREVEVSLSHAVEEIQNTERELEVQGDSVANTINSSFEELCTILERRKQQLLEEARGRVREKIENLKGQEKNIPIASAQVRSIIDYTERCVKHCSDDEVMSMHADIGSLIKREIEKHGKPGWSVEPVEEVDVGVEVTCAEALQQLCLTKAKITQLPVNLVVDKIVNKAEVNKLSEVTLYMYTTKTCNNRPTIREVKMDCQFKSLYDGSLIITNIKNIGVGQYPIQYTPTVRGRHELTVSVDGQQVAGSPFPVFVSIPPTQLDKPVRSWGGIKGPNSIAVNSEGEIIVTEWEDDVLVLDKEGKRLRSITCSQYEMKRLQGIAVDSEDNIYFIDAETNRIFKSNKNCSKVQVREVKQVNSPGYIDIAVVGDEVMVTECHNKGTIMVYDRELNYVRQIVGVDNNKLRCVFPDSHRNLYVSNENSSIQVFNNNGEFLRSFSCDENGVKRLENPWWVCVAGQYVYVADIGKIVVFTTEGDYVTSFGSYGRLCVDKDGFVYVGKYSQNKICIY